MSDVTAHLPPNVEALVTFFLAGQDELTDYVPASRIVTDMAGIKSWAQPAIRVTQFYDNTLSGHPLWLTQSQLQVEAFAGTGGKHEAYVVAALARTLLANRLTGVHSRGIVTSVTTYGMQDIPDDSLEPTHPRWLFTAQVTCHPLPAPIS